MKFLVPNYSCLQNPRLGGYRPQIPVLSVLCPQLNLLNSPEKNSWVHQSSKPKHSVSCPNIYMCNVWKFLTRTLSALNMVGILHVWPCLIGHAATSRKTPVIWNYGIIFGLSVSP